MISNTSKNDVPLSPKKLGNDNLLLTVPQDAAISNINNTINEPYTLPMPEYDSPEIESPIHQEFSIYDMEFTMKDVGNLKEYIYFVSLLNQNFSFKDFAILKITDEKIQLAIIPKESREKYSKYYFDPQQSILNLGEEALKTIFKEIHTVKFQIENQDSSESVLTDDPLKENDIEKRKESVGTISSQYTSSINNGSPIRQRSPTQNSIKTENSETYSFVQSDYSRKTNENYEFENLSNDISNENISHSSSLSLGNSNDSINRSKWKVEDLGKPYDLIILDIEKLFGNTYCAKGSMFKGNSNVFQFNTKDSVYVLQAPTKSKKMEICNIIRIIGGMQNVIQKSSHQEWNPKMEMLKKENNTENEENIVRYIFNTFDKYSNTVSELETELQEKTKTLKKVLDNFKKLSSTNSELIQSLNSTKEKNYILQEKIEKMKETSDSNVNEIRLLHMRLENDKKILKSIMNSFSEIEEKSQEQPKSYKNLLLIAISGIVLIIAFLYIK